MYGRKLQAVAIYLAILSTRNVLDTFPRCPLRLNIFFMRPMARFYMHACTRAKFDNLQYISQGVSSRDWRPDLMGSQHTKQKKQANKTTHQSSTPVQQAFIYTCCWQMHTPKGRRAYISSPVDDDPHENISVLVLQTQPREACSVLPVLAGVQDLRPVSTNTSVVKQLQCY